MKHIDDTVEFRKNSAGDIDAIMPDGCITTDVRFVQLFPLRNPDQFISIVYDTPQEKKGEELGVIQELKELSKDKQKLVKGALKRSFFLPEIEAIKKVTISGGIDEWHVVTDRGDKIITICDRKQSIHTCSDGIVLVTDMDKCRYRMSSPDRLDNASRHMLERVMS